MKKIYITLMSMLCLSMSTNAQIVFSESFSSATLGMIDQWNNYAAPWNPGCVNSPTLPMTVNLPEIKQNSVDKYVEFYGKNYPLQGELLFESIERTVAPLASGYYVVTFDARNHYYQNTPLDFRFTLKNYDDCNTAGTGLFMTETATISATSVWNGHELTFCIPAALHNVYDHVELSVAPPNPSLDSDGTMDIDNVTLTKHPVSTPFEYQIDCATGKLQVRPLNALAPGLFDMFTLIQNSANDPTNSNSTGDVTLEHHAYWQYQPDANGWYTLSTQLQPGVNYYVKRGVWGSCVSWQESRIYNIEMVANNFDASFTYSIDCSTPTAPKLSVTGAAQPNGSPYHMFTLVDMATGQVVENFAYWQQSNGGSSYQQGPFTFNAILDPGKCYYVKRGVWDFCTPWKETRQYSICPTCGVAKKAGGDMLTTSKDVNDILVYPNPTQNNVTVQVDGDFTHIDLVSLSGQVLSTFTEERVNLENYSNGTYLLNVYDGTRNSADDVNSPG